MGSCCYIDFMLLVAMVWTSFVFIAAEIFEETNDFFMLSYLKYQLFIQHFKIPHSRCEEVRDVLWVILSINMTDLEAGIGSHVEELKSWESPLTKVLCSNFIVVWSQLFPNVKIKSFLCLNFEATTQFCVSDSEQ